MDEHFVPLSDSRHDDIAEFIIVPVRQSRRKQEFRSTEIHLISIGDLDFLRVLFQRPDERARTLPLASIDMELPILQERELAAEHRPRPEAVGGYRRDLHRNTASPHICRLTLRNPSVGNRDREATLSTYAWRVGRFPSPWSSRTTAATTDRASPFRRYPSRTWTMP